MLNIELLWDTCVAIYIRILESEKDYEVKVIYKDS